MKQLYENSVHYKSNWEYSFVYISILSLIPTNSHSIHLLYNPFLYCLIQSISLHWKQLARLETIFLSPLKLCKLFSSTLLFEHCLMILLCFLGFDWSADDLLPQTVWVLGLPHGAGTLWPHQTRSWNVWRQLPEFCKLVGVKVWMELKKIDYFVDLKCFSKILI